MKYLFDTDCVNILYDPLRQPQYANIRARIEQLKNLDVLQVSVLSVYELEYSYENAPNPKKPKIRSAISSMEKAFEVLPLNHSFGTIYAKLKASFKRSTGKKAKEMTRHNIDLMIASSAICNNSILVSSDQIYQSLSELYSKLKVEDWTLTA